MLAVIRELESLSEETIRILVRNMALKKKILTLHWMSRMLGWVVLY